MENIEKLKIKYGDKKIMVIKNNVFFDLGIGDIIFNNNFTPITDLNNFKLDEMLLNRQYIYRYLAELDNNYKQPIPYILFFEEGTDSVFCMERLGGDSRLIGNMSLGVGGHIDNEETLNDALYREVKEELGLDYEKIKNLSLEGIIMDTSNEVGSVHIGLLFKAYVSEGTKLVCLEKDKLIGSFKNKEELKELRDSNYFETWSNIAFDNLLI